MKAPRIFALCTGTGRRMIEDQLARVRATVTYEYPAYDGKERELPADVRVIVADLFDPTGQPAAPHLRALRAANPGIPAIISYEPTSAALDDVLDAATAGVPLAFAARGLHDLSHLLGPLLQQDSGRAPSAAAHLLLQIIPKVRTSAARRCVTFGLIHPVHHLTLDTIAALCQVSPRGLHHQLAHLASPKLMLNALAWPQASYMLSALRWRPGEVAAYFGYPRPVLLVPLLLDYVESGLWKFGLDDGVDAAAANVAEWSKGRWPHRRSYQVRGQGSLAFAGADIGPVAGVLWSREREMEFRGRILSLLQAGRSPVRIVRRLWSRYDMPLGALYWDVMQVVHAMSSAGLVEERPAERVGKADADISSD